MHVHRGGKLGDHLRMLSIIKGKGSFCPKAYRSHGTLTRKFTILERDIEMYYNIFIYIHTDIGYIYTHNMGNWEKKLSFPVGEYF